MNYLDRITQRRKKKRLLLRKAFREEAERLASLMVRNYRFKRLYLFGSVIKDGPLAPWSDIDLAVEGLEKTEFFKLGALLLKNAKFPVDLKPFEDIDERTKKKIQEEGEVIYG